MSTTAHLIDLTGIRTLKLHLAGNPEIEHLIQVHGTEDDLAEVGDWCVHGNTEQLAQAFETGRCTFYRPDVQNTVAIDAAVYCLYLPPFYLFIDTNRPYR